MTPLAVLIELLGRLGARNGAAVLVTATELCGWPPEAVAAMKSQHLLAKASPARSAVCPGCERACVMPVHSLADASRGAESFIVCDKRSDINRVSVPIEQLTQSVSSADAVAGFIANCLGLRRTELRPAGEDLLNIGTATGKKRSQMLCLRADGALALVAGNSALPLAVLVGFHDGAYWIDRDVVLKLVDSATTADPRYTPSNAKREARKLNTQAMYAEWQKAYRALLKQRPNMSDVWYAKQIEKTPIAHGRDFSTIKKNMKP